ncbi:MAG: cupin domain-containing protein [Lentisphaerota bacterium]
MKLTLAGLTEYGENTIVSRVIVENSSGTLTVFAFDEGQGLSEHSAPFDAIVQVIDGEADIKINGQSHFLRAGDLIIMPANIPHAVKAVTKFKMLLTMLKAV